MKIIILHASAGAGHRRAAEALENEFSKRTGNEVILRDVLDFMSPSYRKRYGSGYEYVVKHFPWAWGLMFYITDFRPIAPLISFFRSINNTFNTKKLEQFIEKENPDVVISTQFMMTEVVQRMRKRGSGKFKFVVVVTDFDVHSFWVTSAVDEFIVASEFTKDILTKRFKVASDKIKVFGIPIDGHFNASRDRLQLANKFKTDLNKFTVLIVAGTFGMGPLKDLALKLAKENQVIVGCGKNKTLLSELNELAKTQKNIVAIGFIDYVDELMSISDVIITKPGGLTSSESLAIGLPMIFISAIKGQETKNAKYLSDLGVAFQPKSIDEIPSIIKKLSFDPDYRVRIKEKIRKIGRPQASKDIVDYVLETYGKAS